MEKPITLTKRTTCPGSSRRLFLKKSALLTGVLAAGSVLAAFAPSRTWALELARLTQPQADTLLAMGKALYPHKDLPDAVYALLVKDLDALAKDPETAALLAKGVETLNGSGQAGFAGLTLEQQTALLAKLEHEPFFQKVRGQCVTSLYDNAMAYKHFGYEGEVWSRGGYLARGFDDLTWLPDPPADASPPMKS